MKLTIITERGTLYHTRETFDTETDAFWERYASGFGQFNRLYHWHIEDPAVKV